MEFYKNNDTSFNGENGVHNSFSFLKENQSLLYDPQKPINRPGMDFRRGLYKGVHISPKKSGKTNKFSLLIIRFKISPRFAFPRAVSA